MPQDEWEEHETIFLQPWCDSCDNAQSSYDEGRRWCPDNLWGECDECGKPAVKYVRAKDAVQQTTD
jgi:hypothetical protein